MTRGDAHPTDGSVEAQFLEHLELIEQVIAFVCRTNRVPSQDADDFASHVRLRLVESDYAILRKFEGRSSLRTYLVTVIQRLFLDYRNAQWGKWRPSAEARRLGPLAIELETCLSRDGRSFDEACAWLQARHAGDAPREELERLAARLPIRHRRRFEDEAVLEHQPAPGPTPDQQVEIKGRQVRAGELSQALDDALRRLPARDQLLIRWCYIDGRTVATAAVMLREDQKALYRHMSRLLKGLRRELEAGGFAAATVRDLLGVSLDEGLSEVGPEIGVVGPSQEASAS